MNSWDPVLVCKGVEASCVCKDDIMQAYEEEGSRLEGTLGSITDGLHSAASCRQLLAWR